MRKGGSIRTWYLSDEEAERLYREHPQVGRSPEVYCPTCNLDRTYFFGGEDRECDCAYQLQLCKHYFMAGVGMTYQRLDWIDFEGDVNLVDGVQAYLSQQGVLISRGVGLLLWGDLGVGKTLAATLLLKDLVKLGYSCYCTTFAAMVEMFTAGWRDPLEQRYFQSKVVGSEVLLLDDLGREMKRKNKLSESTFDDVLRRRVQDGRPTFITTNQNLIELRDGYGGAIMSLLSEQSIAYQVTGKDYRPEANERMLREITAGVRRPIF